IEGAVKTGQHKGWINVDSFQLGVGRSITSSGKGSDRDTSNPSFSEATFSRGSDKASPELFAQAIYGKSLGPATIDFVNVGGPDEPEKVYLQFELGDAIVSSYSISSGGDRPTESFSLNFVKIRKKFVAFDGGKVDTQSEKKWDIVANKTY